MFVSLLILAVAVYRFGLLPSDFKISINLPQTPRLLATRIDMTIDCLVPSIAASQARRSSSSSALDLAIVVVADPARR
ncbi:hypothetical protein AXX17_AT1G41610 [Arabidopsis thaliana]|uniref:Secreted protein n=1 Tax=Arabidopsis thaliana TaxID=3702 RepID=A0A178WFV0_ARATH|nr:hypothetical protein AXX17_AT1G41610 [Arabidopsis thaliana]